MRPATCHETRNEGTIKIHSLYTFQYIDFNCFLGLVYFSTLIYLTSSNICFDILYISKFPGQKTVRVTRDFTLTLMPSRAIRL